MTHAMIWHSLRCGRLKSMSDTLLLLYSLCGFPACVTTRQLGVKSLCDRLCSRPDLYVISVLSDHLPRHMFLWIISDELTGQWHSCGAGISASCKCVCRGCGGESTWRGGSGSLCWLSDARCRPLSSMCHSAHECARRTQRIHQMLLKHYWHCEGAECNPNPNPRCLDGLTPKVGSVFGSIWAQQTAPGLRWTKTHVSRQISICLFSPNQRLN